MWAASEAPISGSNMKQDLASRDLTLSADEVSAIERLAG